MGGRQKEKEREREREGEILDVFSKKMHFWDLSNVHVHVM